ncbi:sigma-70 family RNA polymerase sigma factor [Marinomonas atlantica]|uniref:sigma-70 family RNA polymerase sigma factor n=1 Tax=Marinomonas atlantica TaxID=1806668 RepID=UPI000835E960|nr:sigma-70 family RNA polymerase sigma factor [Marinomonas atlantica]
MNSPEQITEWVVNALDGNRRAMESLLRAIQPDVYKLSLRFLMLPHEAEDATQDILLKIMLRLAQFKQNSAFKTWVYRIATNHLIDLGKGKKVHSMSFDEFADDLQHAADGSAESSGFEASLLSEVRIGCTLAILQCLESNLRVAYIVGEILEFTHIEAAHVLNLSPAAYRKRISRAKALVENFMRSHCGLIKTTNHCRCHKRVKPATNCGRVNKDNLIFASSLKEAKQFPDVLEKVRVLESARRTAALFRAHKIEVKSQDFGNWLQSLLSQYYAVAQRAD